MSKEENMVRIPTHREPTHPGEMLKEEFLIPMGISQRELADGIKVPISVLTKSLTVVVESHPVRLYD